MHLAPFLTRRDRNILIAMGFLTRRRENEQPECRFYTGGLRVERQHSQKLKCEEYK